MRGHATLYTTAVAELVRALDWRPGSPGFGVYINNGSSKIVIIFKRL